MILYIIRHGDPDYKHDTLTELGHREAEALAAYFKDIKLDKIYTSPMGRAIATALPTCQIKGMDYEILDWTAEHIGYMRPIENPDDCSYAWNPRECAHDFHDFTTKDRAGKIEPLIKNSDAFFAAHGYVKEGYHYRVVAPNNDTIAVFCHAGFASAWISHILGLPPEIGAPYLRFRTSSITEFQFENAEYTTPLLYIGQTPHLTLAGVEFGGH